MRIPLQQRAYLMLMRVPAAKMAKVLSLAERNGLGITLTERISQHRAGGDVEAVVNGLVFAREHSIRLSRREATANGRHSFRWRFYGNTENE